MEAFFCLSILVVVAGASLIYSFIPGIRAFKAAGRTSGEQATALRFLGLNMCEPAVNVVLVTLLFLHASTWDFGPDIGVGRDSGLQIGFALFITAPMAVLLLPVLGLRASDPYYRRINKNILWWGLARWGTNLLAFSLMSSGSSAFLFVFFGFILFWASANWAKQQLNGSLTFPPPSSTQPASGARPVAQASRVAPLPAPIPAPAPLLTPMPAPMPAPSVPSGPPILCPICHAPTALHDEGCLACGLVFASRIPPALQSLSRYTVLRPLGSGGMSSVYLARHQGGGRLVVLKTLASVDDQDDLNWREEAGRCLQQEASLLLQLDHPRIARLLDWVSDGQGDFLVLEYIAGLTLEQRLTHSGANGAIIPGAALPPGVALAYAAGVAETLAYLASRPQPVMHLDIKPANLIMPPDSTEPVLVDFGGAALTRHDNPLTVRLDNYGTPGYAAPEQYRGESSPQSDVYGLGATLYHLLTDDDPGAHPFSFPSLASLPPGIAVALTPALLLDPAARPDATQFGASLRALTATYTLPAPAGPTLAAGGIYRAPMGSRQQTTP